MGPNEGKTYLEQTRCAARALMAFSPQLVGDPIAEGRMLLEYESQHGSLENKWQKHVYSWGPRYVYAGDPLEEGGRSCEKLPEGAKVAATFDFRPTEKGFLERFEKAISHLENPSLSRVLYAPQWGMSSPEELSPAAREMAELSDALVKREVINLKRVVNACQPGYNEDVITKFRNWLRGLPDTTPFPHNPKMLAVNPENLVGFCKILSEERTSHCADALLFGSIAAIVDICRYCANKAQDSQLENVKNKNPLDIFISLALFLTSDPQTDPVQILRGTVQKAINWGFVNELVDVVVSWREIVDNKIEEALNSETTDESYDKLYEAIPFSFATGIILSTLLKNPERLGAKTQLVKGSYEVVDETLVRMTRAVISQVKDFFGQEWKRHKGIVAFRRQKYGEENAEKYVDYVVEQSLLYPRRFKSELLASYLS